MGKFLDSLAKKKDSSLNEMNENQTSLTYAGEKKADIPISTNLQNLQNPRAREKTHWRDRDAAYWKRVQESVGPGAVAICGALQPYVDTFAVVRDKGLKQKGGRVRIEGKPIVFRDLAGTLLLIENDWTKLAERCNREMRDLTREESQALARAGQLLEWVTYHAFNGAAA